MKLQEKFYNFQRCVIRLSEGLNGDLANEIYLSGMVKHYEMAFELGWKVMKDYLEYKGIPTNPSPRDVIKGAFKYGIQINSALWIGMLDFRNKMVHEYGEEAAHVLIQKLKGGFLQELQNTADVMKDLIDNIDESI